MGCITTYTRKMFDPMNPDADAIEIVDIAHALSLTCRGNGHVKSFYSVGQHCVYCALEAKARGYSDRVVLGCLLHDATEAYMSDVPRPFKAVLKEYQLAEEKLIDIIYTKYLGNTLNDEEQAKVKEVDDDLLYFDMVELLEIQPEADKPTLRIELDYTVVPFEDVERAYLELFYQYFKEK